jgi:hypothetical protein
VNRLELMVRFVGYLMAVTGNHPRPRRNTSVGGHLAVRRLLDGYLTEEWKP